VHRSIDIDEQVPLGPVHHNDLMAGLYALGVRPGDKVLAHTSLASLGAVEGGAETVLSALLTAIGPQGTLMMAHFYPLYEGIFNYNQPPRPYTGVIPQLLRTRPGAILSTHPSHPVVAFGPAARALTEGHHRVSSVGKNSPIDRLAQAGGKVLLLGVKQWANTTIHTGEAYAVPPYWGRPRPDRPAGRWAILPDTPPGQQVWVPLPETPGDSAGFHKIEPLLSERGLLTRAHIGRARCRLMPGQGLVEAVVEFLHGDPCGLLCDLPDCTFCPWARQFC
jgi:aminoglycoside 3-N-acetyltransferase